MRKQSIITKPIDRDSLTFEDLYGEISSNWELKAERLQARRWNHMKKVLHDNYRHLPTPSSTARLNHF